MPRAVDPRNPRADMDPASKNLLFDDTLMPKFDWVKFWLGAVRDMIHKIIDFILGGIRQFTGIDLSGIHEVIDDLIDDVINDIGTGANLLKLWRLIANIVKEATGIDLTGFFMEMLPAIVNLLNQLLAVANASGQTVYQLIMLPINIIRQLANVFSGQPVDLNDIAEAFQPLVNAFVNWWSVIGSALPEAIDAAKQALWYIAELLFKLGQNTIGGVADLINKALRQVISPLNTNLWGQIRGAIVPARHVADPSPELLDNPEFIGEVAIADLTMWAHDTTAINPGSGRVVADGTRKTLVSNPIQVTPGMVIPIEILVNYQGLAAVANQNAIRLSVNVYDWQANKTGTVFIAGIASPAGNATNVKLSGSYTAGVGGDQPGDEDAWIAVQLDVTAHAQAGTVWFHHASTKATGFTTPQIGFGVVQGIQGIFDIGGTMQSLWDSMQTALKLDLPGLASGASLADVAQSLHELATNVGLNIQILRTTRTELGLPPVTPENAQVASPGTHVLTLPIEWDYVDAVILGGGGGGGALLTMIAGTGGWYGFFKGITLIRANRGLPVPPGVTEWYYIHENATTITMFVGAGGEGGSGLIGEVGHDGQASSVAWNLPDGSPRTVYAGGGPHGGTSVVTNPNNPNPYRDSGKGPGTFSYNGKLYFGGTNVDRGNGNVPGSPPGGGGGPGILRVIPDFGTWGGPGAHGSCWMRAYVRAELEVTA